MVRCCVEASNAGLRTAVRCSHMMVNLVLLTLRHAVLADIVDAIGIHNTFCPAQTGCIADQAPLMSRLSSTTAYLLGANVPRLNIFKASNTPSGVRLSYGAVRPVCRERVVILRMPAEQQLLQDDVHHEQTVPGKEFDALAAHCVAGLLIPCKFALNLHQ